MQSEHPLELQPERCDDACIFEVGWEGCVDCGWSGEGGGHVGVPPKPLAKPQPALPQPGVLEPPPERQIKLEDGPRRRLENRLARRRLARRDARQDRRPWFHGLRKRFYSDDRWYRYIERTAP